MGARTSTISDQNEYEVLGLTAGTVTTTDLIVDGLTQNSVPFIGPGGLMSEDTSNLLFDDALNRLTATNVSSTDITASNDITAGNDMFVGSSLRHINDSNTSFDFSPDQVDMVLGGDSLLLLGGFFTPVIQFNKDLTNTDLSIGGDTDANLFYTDAGNDRVGMGTNSPDYDLQVVGYQTTSTLGVGEVGTKAGCIPIMDTDLAGWTYITTLNGVLTASTDSCL